MAGEFESTIRSAALKIAKYVEDAAELRVETRYAQIKPDEGTALQVGPAAEVDFATYKLAALSVIKLDGDCQAVIPVREAAPNTGRLEADSGLLDLHERNVNAAIEYRARILNALVGVLPIRTR